MVVFWAIAGLLCLATVAALLIRGGNQPARDGERSEAALAIYKDQLAEIERDLGSGVLTETEADAQRTEVSRRLIAASKEAPEVVSSRSRFPRLAVLAVPLAAGALYWQMGNLGVPDVPRAERLAAAETNNDWDALVARVEIQLEKNPKDLEGWQLLVSNYLNMGRYADALRAMGHMMEITGPSADLYANMAEALVFENKGLMSARALALVDEGLKLSPSHPKALYYQALGMTQDGRKLEAKAAFQKLLAMAPPQAPWRQTVQDELAKLEGPSSAAPQISAEQMQQGASMEAGDRMAMIRTMVDGLDEKLKTNPTDVEGWLRLIRARTVLNEPDKAKVALATARQSFAAKPEQLKLLDALAQELSLQ